MGNEHPTAISPATQETNCTIGGCLDSSIQEYVQYPLPNKGSLEYSLYQLLLQFKILGCYNSHRSPKVRVAQAGYLRAVEVFLAPIQ